LSLETRELQLAKAAEDEAVWVNLPGGRAGGMVRSRSRTLLGAVLGDSAAATYYDDDPGDPAKPNALSAWARPFFDDDDDDDPAAAAKADGSGRKRRAVARAVRQVDSAARQVCWACSSPLHSHGAPCLCSVGFASLNSFLGAF
jgi:hypothetical protein